VNSLVCNHISADFLLPSSRLPWLSAKFRMPRLRPRFVRSLAMAIALTASLFVSVDGADARLKSEWKFGGSLARLISLPFGSALLGNSTFDDVADGSAPMADTAVSSASNAMRPWAAQPTGGSLGGLFNRPGVVGGFSAGFLGAGVLGIVFGHGMTNELTGAASFLGLIFQVTLILMLARLFWTWWRADRSAALGGMSPRQLADAYGRLRNEAHPDIEVETALGSELAEAKNRAFDGKD
jgi:hypothetical protein